MALGARKYIDIEVGGPTDLDSWMQLAARAAELADVKKEEDTGAQEPAAAWGRPAERAAARARAEAEELFMEGAELKSSSKRLVVAMTAVDRMARRSRRGGSWYNLEGGRSLRYNFGLVPLLCRVQHFSSTLY